ncbi:MAG: hypothetical protein K2I52_00825, partial [Muribaculaceae bacterium]|nr:hypothetical protein [Muribaculaceae bacterium]
YHYTSEELYQQKLNPNKKPVELKDTVKNDYVWTFKNGSIRMDPEKIIYMSGEFSDMLLKENNAIINRKIKRELFIADSIMKANKREEAMRRQKAHDDSVLRVKNHENAINEI